jgi:hypothetical protein
MQCVLLCTYVKLFPWGRYQKLKLLDQRECTFKIFIVAAKLPSKQINQCAFLQTVFKSTPSCSPSLTLDIITLLIFTNLMSEKWNLAILISTSQITSEAEQLFISLLAISKGEKFCVY